MTKKSTNTRQKNGTHQTNQPYSNKDSQLFFNQHPSHSAGIKKTRKRQKEQQPTQEIKLETPTEILLAGILEELKTQNMIELIKLQAQQEQEKEELETAEKMQEEDKARFEEVRNSMYI
ncbi:coiled-coil protein [Legionella gratiana]|uniref:Coiled-coil protein n=1 Tax=Legionella gratiana TaxID=45066 RepID=A0A378J2H4_9GAMM|nr:hypothetical protein [Legionella gratiana]KTD14523.1 coiled-coil protein [Legionella gratiana]STX41942.1 coiled-coil protein [Legionella gratiana]